MPTEAFCRTSRFAEDDAEPISAFPNYYAPVTEFPSSNILEGFWVVVTDETTITVEPEEWPTSLFSGIATLVITHPDRDHKNTIEELAAPSAAVAEKEQLVDVRHFLSLSVTDLADLMGVSRQTIYDWLKDESTMRPANAERLDQLYQLAQRCRNVLSKPVPRSWLRVEVEGQKLRALLKAGTLDFAQVVRAFEKFLQSLHTDQRNRSKPLHELALERGFKPMPEAAQRESLQEVADRLSDEK